MCEKTKINLKIKNLLMILFESDGTIFKNIEGSDVDPIGILGAWDTENVKKILYFLKYTKVFRKSREVSHAIRPSWPLADPIGSL